MLQLTTPPDRPRPALLASIGLHVMAASAFGFGPLLAFPEAPGWRGEVWAVTQPVLAVPHEARPVDLRGPAPVSRPVRPSGSRSLPAALPAGGPPAHAGPVLQPGLIPADLPAVPDVAAYDDPGFDGWVEDPTGTGPGGGTGGDDPGGGVPIDIRTGGVPPDIVLPVPLRTPSPGYSDTARIARATGAVILSATIAADGSVVDVTVENDAHPLLSRLAVDAVSRWRYVPARIGPRPVAVILRVTLTFRLV